LFIAEGVRSVPPQALHGQVRVGLGDHAIVEIAPERPSMVVMRLDSMVTPQKAKKASV
jgi:hypothetical protein